MSKYALGFALAFLVAVSPTIAHAQDAQAESETFLDFQVENPVRIKKAEAPVYPSALKSQKVEGNVVVQFVVDERGMAQMNTFKVIRSTDNAFTDAVKRAVSLMTFHPAELRGKKVKQLVQQPYKFTATSAK
jgi:protein TonB